MLKFYPYKVFAFLLAFLLIGFNVYLILANSVSFIPLSSALSAALRLGALCVCFVYMLKFHNFRIDIIGVLFFIFLFWYFFKLSFFFAFDLDTYSKPHSTMLAYFLTYMVFTFVVVYFVKIDGDLIRSLNVYLYLFSFTFCILVTLFFREYLGTVSRLTESQSEGESVISPLILSYTSSLLLGFSFVLLIFYKKTFLITMLIGFSILFGLITFSLGSSRGSVVAVVFSILVLAALSFKKGTGLKISLLLISAFSVLILIVNSLNSSLINRFLSISDAISSGNSSAVRVFMWRDALAEFADNPFWGANYALESFGTHPHNIYIEVLMSAGIIGFIIFLVPTCYAFILLFKLAKNDKIWIFILVLFSQNLVASMFSTSIVTASWLAICVGVALSYKNQSKKNGTIKC